jgi:diguanylate cyclase (GGDEF)-like protein
MRLQGSVPWWIWVGCATLGWTAPSPALLSSSAPFAPAPLRATGGALDLSDWRPERDGLLRLDGEWRHFPRRLLSPGDPALAAPAPALAVLPDALDAADRQPGMPPGHGYATYSLSILLPVDPPPLALRFSTVATAFELWANGEFVARAGKVATTAADERPEQRPQVVHLPPHTGGRLELVLRVSNFHYVRGGPWEPIWLGTPAAAHAARESRLALAIFLAGAFGIIGLYHVIHWAARRQDPSFLYFAVVCFGMALRGLAVEEIYILDLFPGLSWATLIKLEYGSLLIIVPASAMFITKLFPGDQARFLIGGYTCVSLAGLAAVAVLPPQLFSRGLPALQFLCVSAAIVGAALVGRSLVRGREGAGLFLFGLFAIAVTGIHDVLISIYRALPTGAWLVDSIYLQPFGLLTFVLSQAVLLARRSSRALVDLEALARKVREAHAALDRHAQELEQRVTERTLELETANRQLARLAAVDGLTGLGNRLHFDEELRRAWLDHLRRGAPLALVLADVDEFKKYNDRHGHLAGDEALRQVAGAMAASALRPGDLVARYGGEEMVALLPNTNLEAARHIGERMRAAVAAASIPHAASSGVQHVTVSIGVATTIPNSTMQRGALVEQADRALYRAKKGGRNRVEVAANEVG